MIDARSLPCWISAEPTVDVAAAHFRHHLGMPPGVTLDDTIETRLAEVESMFREHAHPWAAVRTVALHSIEDARIRLDHGVELHSADFSQVLHAGDALALAVVAVSAGHEVDREIERRWNLGEPDSALFLAAYAVAVAERLRARAIQRLRTELRDSGEAIFPHWSPGYPGWDLRDQRHLFALLREDDDPAWAGPIEVLDTGALTPVRSTLAAIGIKARKRA